MPLLPFRVEGPALISFSGGRTSASMVHAILQAHGGRLPADVHVAFANTGKEHAATLDFVRECGLRWDVDIHWLERADGQPGFVEVDYQTASRDGEPFKKLIERKRRLPNRVERWCTQLLKVEPLMGFMRSLGHEVGAYTDIIGLRHDEGVRIMKGLEGAEKSGRKIIYPLARAKITKADISAFWSEQQFDLAIPSWQGNCDLCFMKGRGIKKAIIQDNPACAAWWSAQESEERGPRQRGWWDKRYSVARLVAEMAAAPDSAEQPDDDEHDVECGLLCAADSDETSSTEESMMLNPSR